MPAMSGQIAHMLVPCSLTSLALGLLALCSDSLTKSHKVKKAFWSASHHPQEFVEHCKTDELSTQRVVTRSSWESSIARAMACMSCQWKSVHQI
eukprot:3836375-Amphidinium_carterae.1